MKYAIYNPTVTISTIVDTRDGANPAGLTYVSNSSLEYWQGRYWAIMDGTTQGVSEGAPGQQIWLTTSTDLLTWTTPFQPFRNADYCTNPVTGSALEWQPNLVVVGNQLWCTWSGADTYVSKLTSPTGKWTNYRVEFDGAEVSLSTTVTGNATGGRQLRATIEQTPEWFGFFSQNPIVLSSGVVCCPLTFSNATLSTQTTASSTFTRLLKRNAILRADGDQWSMAVIDSSQFGDFSAWEPFVVQNPAGHVYVYSRNLDARVADDKFMLTAVSTDDGQSFSTSISSGLKVPSTRGFARQITPKRWVMTHCDRSQRSTGSANQNLSLYARRNGSVFISRRASDDWIPGINFSGDEVSMNYPQFIARDNKLLINYTNNYGGNVRRTMKLSTVSPLPNDALAYVHPRSTGLYDPPAPIDPQLVNSSPDYYLFNGLNQLWSTEPLTTTGGLTYTAWVKWSYDGTVIADSRQYIDDQFGQVFSLQGLAIGSINFLHGVDLQPDVATFLAATVTNGGEVNVYVTTAGGTFTSQTQYFKSILFSGQPSESETVTINGITYTFTGVFSTANDVVIGNTLTATVENLRAAVAANSMTASTPPGTTRVLAARNDRASFAASSTAANVTVESSIPLTGGPVSFGMPSIPSGLSPYSGRIYDCRIYNQTLTAANLTNLHNSRATEFGHSPVSGTSTAPGSNPLIHLNPLSPANFPLTNPPASYQIIDAQTLRLKGEESASVELPFGATKIDLKYKLGAAPQNTDKYVIATFGNSSRPVRLYFDAANPSTLYANTVPVMTVTDSTQWNTMTVIVSSNKVTIGSVERDFSGKPRCYLGNAYPESLLTPDKYVDFDIDAMNAAKL